jgi:hypothetical protein
VYKLLNKVIEGDQMDSKQLENFAKMSLPKWDELPNIELHLDQVIDLANNYLRPLEVDLLTPTMMHNYLKQAVIIRPQGKLYGRMQLAAVIIIGCLKSILSLYEIKRGFEAELKLTSSRRAYNNFVNAFNEEVQRISQHGPRNLWNELLAETAVVSLQHSAIISMLTKKMAKDLLSDLEEK